MATLSFFFIYILLLYSILPFPTARCRSVFRQQPGKQVGFFVFGDSILDPGNNNYINTTTLDQANFWPYGETFFKYPTGRFSDGRLISDFIAEYAKLPMIPPFLQPGVQFTDGANFASAGAGAVVETFQGSVINLQTQLSNFKKVEAWLRDKLGDFEAKKTISRAVYLISIGSNDYTSLWLTNSTLLESYSQTEYVGMVIGNLTSVIKEIYRMGGRKFGFLSLEPLGCVPGMRALKEENKGGCVEEASTFAKLHNKALSKLLINLEGQLEGFKYSNSNFYNYLMQTMKHPANYGFKEGKTACCGTGPFNGVLSCGGRRIVKEYELCENPNEYVWWDSLHATERTYQLMAKQMWRGAPTVVSPYNLKDLFECFDI